MRSLNIWNKIISVSALAIFIGVINVFPQPLKPKEITYSRLPNNINAPPSGANQPTIWSVGEDGSNDRFITFGTFPRISDDRRFLLFKRFTRHPSFFNPFGGYADFYIRELATGQEILIASENLDQSTVGHFFSPESNQENYEIIFDDSCLMYKMNRNGSGITFLYPATLPAHRHPQRADLPSPEPVRVFIGSTSDFGWTITSFRRSPDTTAASSVIIWV